MAIERDNSNTSTSGRVIELWSLVVRHWFLLLVMGGMGAAMGYVYFVRTPAIYQSSASLLVRNESKNQVPFQGVESNNPNQREQPHALLIVSPLVVERALDKPLSGNTDKLKDTDRLRDMPTFAHLDHPAGQILANLQARPSMRDNQENHEIINLTYRDTDPIVTRAVLDAVVDSYKDFLGEDHHNISQDVLVLIEDARKSLLEQIANLEAEYTQFRQDTPLLFHGESKAKNVHKERMNEIEIARQKLLILVTERRAELQSIKEALATGGNRDAISLMLQHMKPESRSSDLGAKTAQTELFPLLMEEQLLLSDLGPDHPKVKQIQKKIEITERHYLSENPDEESPRRQRRDFVMLSLDAIQHEIRSLDSKLIELDEFYEAERFESKSIAVYEAKNEHFQKNRERMDALYQQIVKRLDELNLLQDYGGYKMAVISPPGIGHYTAPIFSQCLIIGAVLGSLIGFGLAYLFESNDRTFRSPDEVSEHLNLPIVGHVPSVDRDAVKVGAGSKIDGSLIAHFKPKSRVSESYRAIRTALYFSTRGEQHKVIQITSPNPGDGKSTLCANLCISIAQSNKRVLLIDADFRRPKIDKLFSLDKSIGMSSVISGDAELPDAIQATEVENLWTLPCGPRPGNPCELLTSPKFEQLLEVLREQYDFVIVDTPPLLAVTDPSAVAARVDCVLLTIRLTKRTRGESRRAVELLTAHGGNTLGIVVNGVGRASQYSYGGYGRYESDSYVRYESAADGEHPYYVEADESDEAPEPVRKRGRIRSSQRDV